MHAAVDERHAAMSHRTSTGEPGYEPPRLVQLGSVHELTLADKDYGPIDGHTFQGVWPLACCASGMPSGTGGR